MIFKWFDTKDAKQFGSKLAEFYVVRASVEGDDNKKKFVEKKQKQLLQKMLLQITQFKSANKLNFYQKAQLGNTFKWRLIEAGFERDYVNSLTNWLMRNF